ncbi:MAG: VOC family protein [Chloroflexi bacterium]|nr:MAG: VOC family protein [Chloroflexota bacterium]
MATGEITHIEFPADDLDRAKRFYEAVAGWQFSEMEGFPGYWLFRTAEGSGGGLGRRGESVGNVIRDYITVTKLEDAVRAAEQNGGKVVTPPSEIPGMGRWAAVLDSEGNEIGLWEDTPKA